MNLSLCSGWNSGKDGISDYSRYLGGCLRDCGVAVENNALGCYIGSRAHYREAARKANKADICHLQFNYLYFNGELPHKNRFASFARGLRVPLVMTLHEVRIGFKPSASGFSSRLSRDVFNHTLSFWNAWSRIMHREIYRRADRLIVHTRAHQLLARSVLNRPDSVELVPHGIPVIPEADRRGGSEESKKKFGFSGKTVLAVFGFINRRKGYELILEALPQLPDDIVLIIAGGPMTGSVQDRDYCVFLRGEIERAGLGGRVKITGYLAQEEIPELMAAVDICLAPFVSDSASGALSLCIGYGKPVIASGIPGHREIVSRVPCLELLPRDAACDLAAAIRGLAADPRRRRELSLLCGEYARQFSYRRVATITRGIYESVLGRSRSAGGTREAQA